MKAMLRTEYKVLSNRVSVNQITSCIMNGTLKDFSAILSRKAIELLECLTFQAIYICYVTAKRSLNLIAYDTFCMQIPQPSSVVVTTVLNYIGYKYLWVSSRTYRSFIHKNTSEQKENYKCFKKFLVLLKQIYFNFNDWLVCCFLAGPVKSSITVIFTGPLTSGCKILNPFR